MLEWKNVTDNLPENSHQLQGRRIELYEVAEKDVELGLFSCPDGMWGILVCYGKLYGTAYAPSEKIWAYRDAMKPEMNSPVPISSRHTPPRLHERISISMGGTILPIPLTMLPANSLGFMILRGM